MPGTCSANLHTRRRGRTFLRVETALHSRGNYCRGRSAHRVPYREHRRRWLTITRNPLYHATIRRHHLPSKAFQTLGQHLWMQPAPAMKCLAHLSLAATFWRSTSDLGISNVNRSKHTLAITISFRGIAYRRERSAFDKPSFLVKENSGTECFESASGKTICVADHPLALGA